MTNNKAAPGVPLPLVMGLRAAEILWRDVDAEFGLLTATELSLRIGAGTANPGLVNGLYREGRLIAMHRAGQVLFSGFQVQRGTGVVQPVIRDLRQAAGSAGTDQSLITWLVTPSGHLDGARPVDLLDEGKRVLAAASKSFGGL
jgi:hypothetical protein